ncbi:Protein BATH-38 [Aphelenchoides avenae]|nr:Protein BATH-38 [Aphelenchus avenae]
MMGAAPLVGNWGYTEWLTREIVLGTNNVRGLYGNTNNASVTITVDFDVGIDVFSEESPLSDVTLIIQERALFANRGHLAVMSPVFAKMFSKGFKEAEAEKVPLKDVKFEDFVSFLALIYPLREKLSDANVLAAYRLSHYYQVDFMLEDAEAFLHLTTCAVPLIEKLLLAEELDRSAFCDRLVASMSVQDVKTIAKHEKTNQLSTDLMAKILQKYIDLKP